MDLFSMNALMDYLEPKELRIIYENWGQFAIVGPTTMSSIDVLYRRIHDGLVDWSIGVGHLWETMPERASAIAGYCNAHTPFPGIALFDRLASFVCAQWLTHVDAISTRAVDAVIATLRWSAQRWDPAFIALARGDDFIPIHAPPGLGDLVLPPIVPDSEWRFWPIDLAATPEQLVELFKRTLTPERTFEWDGQHFIHSLSVRGMNVRAYTEWDRARGVIRTSATLPHVVTPEARQSVYDLLARLNGFAAVVVVLRGDRVSIESYQFANGDGTVAVTWTNQALYQMEYQIQRIWPELELALRTPKPLAWEPPERGPMPDEDAPLTVEAMMTALERRAEFLASDAYRKNDLHPSRPGVHVWGWDSVVWPEPQHRHSLHDGFIAITAEPPNDAFDVKRTEKPDAIFGHTFDSRFLSSDWAGELATIREANATAQTSALLRALVRLRRPDGRPFFSALDRAMLGIDPEGSPSEGRPVAPQHLEQHLRWKEHETLNQRRS